MKKSKIFKFSMAGVVLVAVVFAGSLFVAYAAQVIDSFTSDFFIKDTWNIEVDTGEGEIKLKTRDCDDDNWFCNASATCLNYMDDGDYIIVAKQDVSTTTTFQWKNSQTYCVAPHCEVIGGDATLVADNTVNFFTPLGEQYPARESCKEVGGRLPTINELECIYQNRVLFGDNFASAHYWSASEVSQSNAGRVSFSDGSTGSNTKTGSRQVRCVFGY